MSYAKVKKEKWSHVSKYALDHGGSKVQEDKDTYVDMNPLHEGKEDLETYTDMRPTGVSESQSEEDLETYTDMRPLGTSKHEENEDTYMDMSTPPAGRPGENKDTNLDMSTPPPLVIANFEMEEKKCYKEVIPPKSTAARSGSKGTSCAWIIVISLLVFLALGLIASCIAFALEIHELKSGSALTEEGRSFSTIVDKLDKLNSSIIAISQQLLRNVSVVENNTQELNSFLTQQVTVLNDQAQEIVDHLFRNVSAINSSTQELNDSLIQRVTSLQNDVFQNVSTIDSNTQELISSLYQQIAILQNRSQEIADSGGVQYIRWGRTICPNTNGTELVYSGRASGSFHNEQGGGANYLCLPDEPEFLEVTSGVQRLRTRVYGAEYQAIDSPPALNDLLDFSVPCAACYTAERGEKIMIPAKVTCPSSWTREYNGYLMAERYDHSRVMFECMDVDAERINGTQSNDGGVLFYFTEVFCTGINCPPYTEGHELACVVCTR